MGIWLKGDGMVGWGFGLVDLSQIEGKREQKDGCWLGSKRRFDAALHCTYIYTSIFVDLGLPYVGAS